MKRNLQSLILTLGGLVLAVPPAPGKDNTPPPGFKALFNGKDLQGWQGLVELPQRAKLTKEEFEVKQKEANEKYLPHWTVRDGVLYYDGKGQSGIYVRGTPQVQIWDRPVGSGGLFNNQKNPKDPLKNADKPVGEWNTFRITMRGDTVSIWLNGELVVDKVTMENYWERGKPLPSQGPIELQHHGNPIEFKNIYIKELK